MKGLGLLAVAASQAPSLFESMQASQPDSQLVLAAQAVPAASRTHSRTRLLRLIASPRA